MSLDPRLVLAQDLESYFVDKDTGLPLAGGIITFYRDANRNIRKEVWQLSGSPPNYTYTTLGSQITLSSVGTIQNSLGDNVAVYYKPYITTGTPPQEIVDLYYITVESSGNVSQFTREGWPNITTANDAVIEQFPIENQISNSQFTNILINDGVDTVYSVTSATLQVFEFAPNWDFVISGTGNVTVQRYPIAGNDNLVTNPPYVLDVSVDSGITKCNLRQRFSNNSGLWTSTDDGDIYLSGLFIAKNVNNGTTGAHMYYAESSGPTATIPITIVDASFNETGYSLVDGETINPIPHSVNTDEGISGYIDIFISFLPSSHIRISSIQVIPTEGANTAQSFSYDLNSSNREQAYMGDYYIPRAITKTIPSLLTAWDFPLNPMQFGASGSIGASGAYIADQTIAARGATNVTYARSAITSGLAFTTAGTSNTFYVLQYLSGAQAKKILGTRLSCNVFAYKDSVSDDVTMRVYLYRGSSAATFPTLGTTIGTIASSGVFTLTAGNWTEIERSGLGVAKATLNSLTVNSDLNDGNFDYGFTGWEVIDDTEIGDTNKFAIVVTFAYVDASTVITLNSVSVVPGDLPCRPANQSYDEVLRECQYYYETNYVPGVAEGTISTTFTSFMQLADASGGNIRGYGTGFTVPFETCKRSTPAILLYRPETGTVGNVSMGVYSNGTLRGTQDTSFTTVYGGTANVRGYNVICNNGGNIGSFSDGGSTARPFAVLYFNYSASARLGIES